MRQESWVKCYAKYYGDAIKAADHDALSFSLSPPALALTLPAASFRGCRAAARAPCTLMASLGHFSSSPNACARHAQQIDREQREGWRESRSRAWERESANSVAWKSATATAAAAALTLSATVNSLLTCAKPFVYFCLAADTKKITKRAAKIKGRAQKCCKSKIRWKQLSQACTECCSQPVALFILVAYSLRMLQFWLSFCMLCRRMSYAAVSQIGQAVWSDHNKWKPPNQVQELSKIP